MRVPPSAHLSCAPAAADLCETSVARVCFARWHSGAACRARPCRKKLLAKQTLRGVTSHWCVKSDVQSMIHRFTFHSRLRHHKERDCAPS